MESGQMEPLLQPTSLGLASEFIKTQTVTNLQQVAQ